MPPRTWTQVSPNGTTKQIPLETKSFTLSAPPKTDIWRPSKTEDTFNAPYIYTSIPRSSTFKSLAVTVSAAWKTKYDQGGLLILWPGQSGDAAATTPKNQRRWVKTGIEFFEGKAALSVVGCDRFSDWSLSLLPAEAGNRARILAQRDGDTLWVYYVDGKTGEKRALREIKWAFLEGDEEMWVGVAVAKPTPDEGNAKAEVEVQFRDLEVEG